MNRKCKSLLLGALYNFLFLSFCAIIYNFFLRLLVLKYEWAFFFGHFWFFVLEMSILPIVNMFRKKKYLAIGNLLGIILYFVVLMILFAIFGD